MKITFKTPKPTKFVAASTIAGAAVAGKYGVQYVNMVREQEGTTTKDIAVAAAVATGLVVAGAGIATGVAAGLQALKNRIFKKVEPTEVVTAVESETTVVAEDLVIQ